MTQSDLFLEITKPKIKLVVFKEHTLGYINPNDPNTVWILHTSPIKGSPTSSPLTSSFPINNDSEIRLASEKDFDEYRVHFGSYNNKNLYEYENN
jgi:hypothetical protein